MSWVYLIVCWMLVSPRSFCTARVSTRYWPRRACTRGGSPISLLPTSRPACDSVDIQRQYNVGREIALVRDVVGLESDPVRVLEEH